MIKLIFVFVQIEFYLPAMLLGGWPDCCVCECSPAMPSGWVEVRLAVGATCCSGPFLYVDQDYHLYLTSPSHPHSSPHRWTPHTCNMRPSMFHCCHVTIIRQPCMCRWIFSLKNNKKKNCKEIGALGPEQGQHDAAHRLRMQQEGFFLFVIPPEIHTLQQKQNIGHAAQLKQQQFTCAW